MFSLFTPNPFAMKQRIFLVLLFVTLLGSAQNTVGILSNTSGSLNGYTLFSPRTGETPRYTYLLNNCGEVEHKWESTFPLFSTDYLMPDGTLYRSVIDNQSTLNIPGNTGRIEHLDWDGNLIWGLTYSDTDFSFHHDYVVLDNGNILMLVAVRRTEAEAIQAGRDPATMAQAELYEETVLEIQPVGTDSFNIIWEWRSWDHLIQDFDATKDNFGVVADHPELVNINYGINVSEADWWHSNALSYSPELDQIIISNRDLNEFIVIDHSTTTAEAATSSGGNSGMGGDILYRWGNPESYDQGTSADRKLFAQHDVQFIQSGLPNAGKIMIFNNGLGLGFSRIQILDPPFDSTTNTYTYSGGAYGPENPDYEYMDPIDPTNFFAPFLSGVQELSNGNLLICNGPFGTLFEVDTNDNSTVWQYQSPVGLNGILEDGEDAANFETRVFRALRYPADYIGITSNTLTNEGPIELNPVNDNCQLLSVDEVTLVNNIKVIPTITSSNLTLANLNLDINNLIKVYDFYGRLVLNLPNKADHDVSKLATGTYFISIESGFNNRQVFKFIKK